MKSKTTATILCFLLGGVGAHKFYLGSSGIGFLYLLFCWSGLPALAAFFETIGFLLMSEEAFNQKYNLTHMLLAAKTQQGGGSQQNVTIQLDRQSLGIAETPAKSSKSVPEQLAELNDLLTKGAITDEEYQSLKANVLNN